MYFWKAELFQRPVDFISDSDALSWASCVARPMRNECVLYLSLGSPSNSQQSLRNLLNSVRVKGCLFLFTKSGPICCPGAEMSSFFMAGRCCLSG